MRIEEHACGGNCLEAIGIPNKGIAVIDRDMKPEVFDVVWCSGCVGGELGGFLKQIIKTGKNPVVRTQYKDGALNYAFFPAELFGVVLNVMDIDRNIVWERPEHLDYTVQKHGRWEEWWPGISLIMTGEEMLYRCSCCDAKYPDVEAYKFCPHCGAMMDLEE